MNNYQVDGQLEDGRSFSLVVNCENEKVARAVIFQNFAYANVHLSKDKKLMVAFMNVSEFGEAN